MDQDSRTPASPWAQVATDLISLRGDLVILAHDLAYGPTSWYDDPTIVKVAQFVDEAQKAVSGACAIMAAHQLGVGRAKR